MERIRELLSSEDIELVRLGAHLLQQESQRLWKSTINSVRDEIIRKNREKAITNGLNMRFTGYDTPFWDAIIGNDIEIVTREEYQLYIMQKDYENFLMWGKMKPTFNNKTPINKNYGKTTKRQWSRKAPY